MTGTNVTLPSEGALLTFVSNEDALVGKGFTIPWSACWKKFLGFIQTNPSSVQRDAYD